MTSVKPINICVYKSETNICPTIISWITISTFISVHTNSFATMYSSIIVCDVNFFRKNLLGLIKFKMSWTETVVSDKYIKISSMIPCQGNLGYLNNIFVSVQKVLIWVYSLIIQFTITLYVGCFPSEIFKMQFPGIRWYPANSFLLHRLRL